MRRFSIAGLMAVIMVCALGGAALRNASFVWAGLMTTLTIAILGASVLGVLNRRGGPRAYWQGFALFGWGYLLMVYVPWVTDALRPPTPLLLTYVHERVGTPTPARGDYADVLSGKASGVYGTTDISGPGISFTFKGASNREHFLRVGHDLVALLAGLTGGLLGRWFHRTNRGESA